MTLQQCIKQYGLDAAALVDCMVIYPDKFPIELWQLSDYTVSSVSGGCVWLIKRKKNVSAN